MTGWNPQLTRLRQQLAQIASTPGADVLTRGGDTLPLPGLPGLPDHRLLAPGSRILATAARELADTDTHVTFLAPAGGRIGGFHNADEEPTAGAAARTEPPTPAARVLRPPQRHR
jgi:hypothetical protein